MSEDKNIEEVKKIVKSLKSEVNNFQNALSRFETNVALIQTGDGKKPYWNGTNAYYCVDKSLNQIDYDYNLLKNLNKCVEYLENLTK